MAFLFPGFDVVLGFLALLGSPSLGYVVLRSASASSSSWNAWKRLVGGGVIGIGWLGIVFILLLPMLPTPIFPSQLAEFAGVAGIGLFLLTGMTGLVTRTILHPALLEGIPGRAPFPAMKEETMGKQNPSPSLYKPSQLRAKMPPASSPARETMEAPVLENDVLSLLKEENEAEQQTPQKAPSPPKMAPMGQLSDFGGFDETLAQLKRDLKEFNESVSSPHSRKKTTEKENT